MKRRINIEILSDDLGAARAVEAVKLVIEQGRISNNGTMYCYATTYRQTEGPRIAVEAKYNSETSDSFKVYFDKR